MRFGVCIALALQLSNQAAGSCGDYLQHGPMQTSILASLVDVDSQAIPLANVPYSPPSGRCRTGNCQGQMPINAPTNDKVRWDDRRTDMSMSVGDMGSTDHDPFGNVVDESLLSQTILDVAVPPPKS